MKLSLTPTVQFRFRNNKEKEALPLYYSASLPKKA